MRNRAGLGKLLGDMTPEKALEMLRAKGYEPRPPFNKERYYLDLLLIALKELPDDSVRGT